MTTWMMGGVSAVVVILAATGLFFFLVTRGALMWRAFSGAQSDDSHVYPIYSNMRLIKMIDFQPIISAILLFQYKRLVSTIISELDLLELREKKVLITSCAFGNVIPRVVKAVVQGGAERVLIVDILRNELIRAETKVQEFNGKVEFIEDDATALKCESDEVAANVIFFLLHELPDHQKGQALIEAGRVLAPGGRLLIAEFHRPDPWVLRALSWTYFKVFEPLGLAIWDTHDPLCWLENAGGWNCARTTYFFGNFQIITATKL